MNRFKKFWIIFLSFLPFGAGAFPTLVIGGISLATIGAYSIYRSAVPVNLYDSYMFFSSCWSCQMFSDIMSIMSSMVSRLYHELGPIIITASIMLTGIWFAWTLLYSIFNSKIEKPWDIASTFGLHILKVIFVSILLVIPFPRLVSDVAIGPIFNVGLTLNRMVVHDDSFDKCVVATAIEEGITDPNEAFSPKLRHNLTCELAGVHQMTGLGMAIGWTVLNMAFDPDYFLKIIVAIPWLPNIFMIMGGAMLIGLFFLALVPIPLYLLEVFIKLSMDFIMLPLMLLAWLFKGWKISLEGVGNTLKSMIDNVISATLGIAMTGIFVSFAIMCVNALFGNINGFSEVKKAFDQNDSKMLINSLVANQDVLINIILMGVFMAMFMTMIPTLIKTLFNVQISTEFYDKAKGNLDTLWEAGKKIWKNIKK